MLYNKFRCFYGLCYYCCSLLQNCFCYHFKSSIMIFSRNAMHCISHYANVVCVCLSLCVCRVCGRQENGLRWRRRFFFKLHEMTPDIACKSFTQMGYKFQDGGQNGGLETLELAVTQPLINMEPSFFTELCVMTSDISCRSLTQIRLQIPRWQRK